MSLHIRLYTPDDAEALYALFYATVHTVNRRDYTPAQLDAWAPAVSDLDAWRERFAGRFVVIAEQGDTIAGFGELASDDRTGTIDRFYVHKDFQGKGVGTALYDRLEREARARGLQRLDVDASLTARRFFARQGFVAQRMQQVERRGVMLANVMMQKRLQHSIPPDQKDSL